VRGRALPADGGYIAVVDDISRQMQAAREATWEEAGRRFAHEIKNPLTPVQLAAERLSARLKDKLADDDARALEKATATIVNQVGAMKKMVDYFRASSAPAGRREADLNAVMEEVASLYQGGGVAVHLSPASGGLRVAADEVALRQILHNLLANAREATLAAGGGAIDISAARADNRAVFYVQDSGGGMPAEIIGRAFEPYVTTKRGGTGLGLAVVKKLIDEAGGEIALANIGGGVRAAASLPLTTKNNGASQAENSHR
jgi:nitrogen fixation/metabolism regulation signal transduction histidine kinase